MFVCCKILGLLLTISRSSAWLLHVLFVSHLASVHIKSDFLKVKRDMLSQMNNIFKLHIL